MVKGFGRKGWLRKIWYPSPAKLNSVFLKANTLPRLTMTPRKLMGLQISCCCGCFPSLFPCLSKVPLFTYEFPGRSQQLDLKAFCSGLWPSWNYSISEIPLQWGTEMNLLEVQWPVPNPHMLTGTRMSNSWTHENLRQSWTASTVAQVVPEPTACGPEPVKPRQSRARLPSTHSCDGYFWHSAHKPVLRTDSGCFLLLALKLCSSFWIGPLHWKDGINLKN